MNKCMAYLKNVLHKDNLNYSLIIKRIILIIKDNLNDSLTQHVVEPS